jgi:quinoprotein dehydrogenase-associated probable ABC transporter substrate-binding protein
MRSLADLLLAAAVLALLPAGAASTAAADDGKVLRVCADPNNLPFSNRAEEGFENKLAQLVAQKLGMTVSYTWWAQRRGFVRHTLKAGDCDVVMGVPVHYDLVETTQPYYRSTYVFVTQADRHLDLRSIKDPRLNSLKIGVHLIGDDGTNTPPAHALGQEGLIDNVVGFMIYGDYRRPNPPAALIQAVEQGTIDVAAAWGPLAGFAAKQSPVPLTVHVIEGGEAFAPLRFQFDIAMGVRHGDHALRQKLDGVIAAAKPEIEALLASYGVPLLPRPVPIAAGHAGDAR